MPTALNEDAESIETFEELFHMEHRRFDQILADVEALSGRTSFVQAAKRFGEFRQLLERHVIGEERVLLPLFVERTADVAGVVASIGEDHRRLADLVEAIAASISQWDRARFCELVPELRAAMHVHHERESASLYPALGSLLNSATDWWALCSRAGLVC